MARYLVTSALPYANGPLHLGHLAGAYLPADVYVRFLRSRGEEVAFVCGTDEHGVPITITAERQGRTAREVVDEYHGVIRREFEEFGISFDNFSRTSLPEHHEFARGVFLELLAKGHIVERPMKQLFCPRCSRYLPDRYVTGTCPRCGAPGARGDLCESCGSWLDALELPDPGCSLCGDRPVPRETTHWFLRLDTFQEWLGQWLSTREGWRDNVMNYCRGWLDDGLQERAITRDIDWGVPVPLPGAAGKVLYVWFEALLGYVSSTRELFARRGAPPDEWERWWKDPETRLVHFIGKDNIVFHAIIEPAILHGLGGYVLPWNIPANEFLNIGGAKQSTSRGTAVWMGDCLKRHPPDPMRYALCINAPEGRDTDFTWADFRVRNNELADVLGNFVHRTASFAAREFGGRVPDAPDDCPPLAEAAARTVEAAGRIAGLLEGFRIKAACAEAMELARAANRFFDAGEPWKTARTDRTACAATVRACLEQLDWLRTVFQPFLPGTAGRMAAILGGRPDPEWRSAGIPSLEPGASLGRPEILFTKLDEGFETVSAPEPAPRPGPEPEPVVPGGETVSIKDFQRISLKVGRIVEASAVEGADRLLRLMVDIGEPAPRQIVAGMRKWYSPGEMVGRGVIVVANLEPAMLRGVESNGMILATDGASGVFLIEPSVRAEPGDRVR